MMHHFIRSEAGYNHKNEDAVTVRTHPEDEACLLCALADGQGGQVGGAAASRLAVERCLELASSYTINELLDTSSWYEILRAADEAVSDELSAGYTTLVGLCAADGKVCGASCGDSAALLVGNGQHTLLTEKQWKNPPVGSSAAFPVAFSTDLNVESKILVVSDGVWKHIDWDSMIELCSQQHGQKLLLSLHQLSLQQNGGKLWDDFSIALLEQN